MLPGVPREMRGMLADELLPLCASAQREAGVGEPPVVRSRTLRTTSDRRERDRRPARRPLARGVDGLSLAYLPGHEGVDLRLTARDLPAAEADAALAARHRAALRERVGRLRVRRGRGRPGAVVLDALPARRAHARGGRELHRRAARRAADRVPGSSDVVLGGTIAYANA
jgi:nicotinamide-nucleotide amidase